MGQAASPRLQARRTRGSGHTDPAIARWRDAHDGRIRAPRHMASRRQQGSPCLSTLALEDFEHTSTSLLVCHTIRSAVCGMVAAVGGRVSRHRFGPHVRHCRKGRRRASRRRHFVAAREARRNLSWLRCTPASGLGLSRSQVRCVLGVLGFRPFDPALSQLGTRVRLEHGEKGYAGRQEDFG